jgi:hypothetical protein
MMTLSFLPPSLFTLIWFNVLQLFKCYMVFLSLLTVHRPHKFNFHIIYIHEDKESPDNFQSEFRLCLQLFYVIMFSWYLLLRLQTILTVEM